MNKPTPLETLCILLVEDNPGDIRLVQEALKECNVPNELLIAHDGVEALETLTSVESVTPDVVLLDLNLPRKTGLEVLAELKHHPEVGGIPVVILTGLDDESVALEAIRLGAQDYLIKGELESRMFARVIRYSIERKQAAIEREQLIRERKELFSQIQTLRNLLPMCAWCKRIRDEDGNWRPLEKYISEHSSSDVTHGICPECKAKMSGV